MKDLKQFIKTTIREFLNENQTYTINGYKYTNILTDGDFDYELVESLNNKTGIDGGFFDDGIDFWKSNT